MGSSHPVCSLNLSLLTDPDAAEEVLLVTGPQTVSSETGDKRVGFLTNKEYLTGAVTNIGMHILPLVLSLTEEENNTSGFSSR